MSLRLSVLGASTPYPRPDEPCSGYLVRSTTTAVWVDAGTGTLAELQRHIRLDALDAIWISHHHADHSADLLTAYYALRFADDRPTRPVPLVVPEGLVAGMAGLLGGGAVDTIPRIFDVRVMDGAGSARIGDLELAWRPVDHGVPAFGLRIEDESGRMLAYSGDSGPGSSVVAVLDGCDTALVEVGLASSAAGDDRPVHHTPEDAGRMATEARVGRLVLTHIDGELGAEEARERAASAYDGEILVARRGLALEI